MNIEAKDWVLIVISTLIGIAISWYFFRLGKPKGKVLAYATRGQVVLDHVAAGTMKSDVAITYKGMSIPRLSVCKVAMWNDGDQMIGSDSLVAGFPLSISAKDNSELLEITVQDSPPESQVKVDISADKKLATIAFDFLNPGQEFTLRVLHCGAEAAPAIAGSLKGGKLIKSVTRIRTKVTRQAYAVLAVFFIYTGLVYGLFFFWLQPLGKSYGWALGGASLVLFAIALVIGVKGFSRALERYVKNVASPLDDPDFQPEPATKGRRK